jgi:hypothetical protein
LVILTFEVIKEGKCEIKLTQLKDNIKSWPVKNGVFSGEKNKSVK